MEPQNNTTPLSEPMQDKFPNQPPMNTFGAPRPAGNRWKIISIIAIILAVVFAALTVVFMLMMGAEANKAADAEDENKALTNQLSAYKEVTGTSNASEYKGTAEVDFAPIAALIGPETPITLGESYIRTTEDGAHQIAQFLPAGSETHIYLFRTLPSGEWQKSALTGPAITPCSSLTPAEQAAFAGIVECLENPATPAQ